MKLRITHISDTHNKHNRITEDLPGGDIIIHSGDFSSIGRKSESQTFVKWFGKLPYKYKIFIAGNHDLSFESEKLFRMKSDWFDGKKDYDEPAEEGKPYWVSELLEFLPDGVIYLENESVEIEGVKIWGSPFSARFGRDWAFNVDRGEKSRELWGTVPTDTNILITHGPAFGVGDRNNDGLHVGCEDLRERVINLEPDIHLSGHIHEAYGYTHFGNTHSINGSNLNLNYLYLNKPITFDYDFETKEIEFI